MRPWNCKIGNSIIGFNWLCTKKRKCPSWILWEVIYIKHKNNQIITFILIINACLSLTAKLATDHSDRVLKQELRQQKILKERQETFDGFFQDELEDYKATGIIRRTYRRHTRFFSYEIYHFDISNLILILQKPRVLLIKDHLWIKLFWITTRQSLMNL